MAHIMMWLNFAIFIIKVNCVMILQVKVIILSMMIPIFGKKIQKVHVHFTDFRHNKGTIAALELMTKLKIDAHRTASGTQGGCMVHSPIKRSQSTLNTVYNQARRQARTSAPMSYRRQCQMRNS